MRRLSLVSLLCLLISGCPAPTPEPVAPGEVSIDLPAARPSIALSPASIREAVAFLADDAQRGRAPGSDADARVQAWIVERMRAAGLESGAGADFRQRFDVGDGVRLRGDQTSQLGAIDHGLLPFGHDTGEDPVAAKLVFVGDGLDLDGLAVAGKIVVALAGSADPHASPAQTRPQAKLIAARDGGAVGFVLWDPHTDQAFPNHGRFNDLEIPALFVGRAGSEALREALRVRPQDDLASERGASSRRRVELRTPIEAVILETANLIGRLPGSGGPERQQIIIGAHMDHLGLGTSSSLAPGERAVHNGADDNASGVAVILELAAALAAVPAEARVHDLVFVAFGAEEMGLLGSKHMVEAMTPGERGQVLAMLNFDMVGRLGERLAVNGRGTAEQWEALVEAANAEAEQALALGGTADGWGPSDHASFYGEGVPVLHFFTGAHADYHKPSDDLDKFDEVGAARVGELAGRIALSLLERREPLTFVKVDRPNQGARAFKVSLGTMPDYAVDVDGLALAGVREGGPAAAAGLQKGDVIKRIGAREVHNIDDYMACFAELAPGVAVEIEWDRGGQRQTGELVPAAPR